MKIVIIKCKAIALNSFIKKDLIVIAKEKQQEKY